QETDFVTKSILCVPLKAEKRILGALEVINRKDDDFFGDVDLEIFQALAGFAAVAIDNARLAHDLERLFRDSVRSLVNLIEASDAYTRGHSERVTSYAGMLVEAMGLSMEIKQSIETAGMLHDIGKIGIGPEIIRKPGKLSDEEFKIIQQHPEIGFRSVKDIHLLEGVLPGILHHHERFDGRGYPRGLAGEEIPFMARIIAIADTYDAMTSTRPYRPALPVEVALAEIERCAGTQFDPRLVPFFIRAIREAAASGSAPVSA
ncbi:MAG: HD-GYP domain-containing protein, partial [Bacteroidota bacterium]